jgi:hypothetical protein
MRSAVSCRMLADMKKTISMADLARNTERIAKDIERQGIVYRIKRPGRRTLLLMDKKYFDDQLFWSEFVARHPNWEQEMEENRRALREGRCITLEQFLQERGLADPQPQPRRAASTRGRLRPRRQTNR